MSAEFFEVSARTGRNVGKLFRALKKHKCKANGVITGCRFGVNGVNIGLFCSTPMVALTRNIPRKQAFEMLTTGEFISAHRAAELGLINRAVPGDQLTQETEALAEKIAAKLGTAVAHGKGAFYQQMQMPSSQAYAFTGEVMVRNMLEAETREGIDAFLEKRRPDWPQ